MQYSLSRDVHGMVQIKILHYIWSKQSTNSPNSFMHALHACMRSSLAVHALNEKTKSLNKSSQIKSLAWVL